MIVVRLKGGLGNQMFQYAAGMRLAHIHDSTLKLDVSFLNDYGNAEGITPRDLSLDAFDLDLVIANPDECRISQLHSKPFKRFIYRHFVKTEYPNTYYLEKKLSYNPSVRALPDNTFLDGYFQDERYFSDIGTTIQNGFRNPSAVNNLPSETEKLSEEIQSCNSVCLHVRRGDYVSNPTTSSFHGVCSLGYYETALQMIRERNSIDKIFVFSDDVEWCRANFPQSEALIVVGDAHSGHRSSVHLWLMSLCKHFVIANSSFSWWAAWLGDHPDKIVVRPSRWFLSEDLSKVDICPSSWISVP